MNGFEKMIKWATNKEDVEIFNVGYSKRHGYHINTRHTDKRFVEAFGKTMPEAMEEFSKKYQKVMTVKDKFNE